MLKVIMVVGLGLAVAVSTALQALQQADGQATWRPYVLLGALMAGVVSAWQLVVSAQFNKLHPAPPAEQLTDGDPRRIGPYRIVARLGSGAMGRAYLARRGGDPRYVALKVIRPEYADSPEFRRRFTREIEAAEGVRGRFTAPLLDADPAAPQPWFVTAYVAGPSLQQAIEAHGPWPVAAVWRLASGAAEALRAVHAAGVVHRDLKPSNILLDTEGPRVIDFGIALSREASRLTSTANRPGTPAYMAPEQATGAAVGPPADVFALGVVLAYAATGRTPFGDGTSDVVLYRVVHQPPDLSGIDAGLRGLIAACLDKDPARRPTPDQIVARCQPLLAVAAGRSWLPAGVSAELAGRPTTAPQGPLGWAPAVVAAVAMLVAIGSAAVQFMPSYAGTSRPPLRTAPVTGSDPAAPIGDASPSTSATASPSAGPSAGPSASLEPSGPASKPPPTITATIGLTAVNASYEGVCDPPADATTYQVKITVSAGPVTVRYRVRNTDGGGSATAVKTLTFGGTGPQTQSVTHHESGYLPEFAIDGTLVAELTAPTAQRSGSAPYHLKCTGPPQNVGSIIGSTPYVGPCPHRVTYTVDVSVPAGPPMTISYHWRRTIEPGSDETIKTLTFSTTTRISHTETYTASTPDNETLQLIITTPTTFGSIIWRHDGLDIDCR